MWHRSATRGIDECGTGVLQEELMNVALECYKRN